MKMKIMIVAGIAVLAVAAGVVTVAVAQDKEKGKEWSKNKSELVTLAQTPEVVQKTIQQYATAADIKKIEKEEENGQMAYSIEIVKGGMESELDVAADGTLTSADEEMALGDAPEAVQKALAAQTGKAIEISKLTEEGVVQYEATLEQNGEEQEISITAEGQVTAKNDAEDGDEDGNQKGEHKGHWDKQKCNGGEREGHWGERKGRHGDRDEGHGEGDKD